MSFRVMHPQWIYAACFAVPFILLALRWFASMSLLRRWSAVLLRLVLFCLLALLLAGTSAVRTTDKFAVIFIVDVSKSMDRPISSIKGWDLSTQNAAPGTQRDIPRSKPVSTLIRRFIDETAARRGPDDMVGIVAFARQAAAVVSPTRSTELEWSPDLPLGEATNIEDAIRLARAMLPPDAAGRIVLFSDGVQTTGDALAAASRLAGQDASTDGGAGSRDGSASRGSAPICVIPVEYDVKDEVYVESLDAPPHATAGATVSVRVVLVATSATSGTLRLLDEQRPIDLNGPSPGDGRRVSLVPGQNVIVMDLALPPGRIHRFKAIYEGDVDPASPPDAPRLLGDTLTQNNVAEAFTITPGQGAILHLNGVNAGVDSTLSRTLVEAGFNVETVRPDSVPADLLTLQTYDLVIFENVGADAVSPDRQRLLLSYVKDLGGGLLIVGGPDAFGGGGWRGSELASIFPVELELPDRIVTPDSAIVFVIDNSGSMGFHVQGSVRSLQEIANESTALAIKSLEKGDLVGVISFNDGFAVRIPLAPNTNPEASAAIARSIHEGGGTVAGPALEEAANQLAPIQARSKHILLLSDGRSQGAESLAGLAAGIKERGITVSAISLGDIADRTTMQAIATRGGGEYYEVMNAQLLPRVFMKAIRVIRSPLVREGFFTPRVGRLGSPLLAGVGNLPNLGGIALTAPRKEISVVNALVSDREEPLLAHWQVELGQVAAFTSDASKWASEWINDPSYRKFWVQAARSISRASLVTQGIEGRATIVDGKLSLRLDANRPDSLGNGGGGGAVPIDQLDVQATIYSPSGETSQVGLRQTGPGTYEAGVDAGDSGSYIAVIKPRGGGGGEAGRVRIPPVVVGAANLGGVEYRQLTSNAPLLRQIATASGGEVLTFDDGRTARLFDRGGIKPLEVLSPIWQPLLIWTLIILILDIATRRVAWDRWLGGEFGRTIADSVKDRGAAAAAALAALRNQPQDDAAVDEVNTISLPPGYQSPIRTPGEQSASSASILDRRRQRAMRDAGAPPASPPPDPGQEGGLLAAKRRAAERFKEE